MIPIPNRVEASRIGNAPTRRFVAETVWLRMMRLLLIGGMSGCDVEAVAGGPTVLVGLIQTGMLRATTGRISTLLFARLISAATTGDCTLSRAR